MQAVVFVGIQGSGKSTFYQHRFFHTHVRLSLDLLRTRRRERIFQNACLTSGQRFVIDNTNVRRAERAVYIAAAKAAQFSVICYYFAVPLRAALQRNGLRTGKQLIPVKGVIGTLRKLEPPKYEEGFDEIYTVEVNGVNEWSATLQLPPQADCPFDAAPRPESIAEED